MPNNNFRKNLKFIDLFAGIGGFRIGFEKEGCKCVFSSEIDKNCQKTYFMNFSEWPRGDIMEIEASTIPDHNILTAGFPCQPFSISGKMKGFEDTRGTLFFEILRIAEVKKTPVLLLENVQHLVHHNNGSTLATMIKHLEELGYAVAWRVLNASDFGVPQNRERIIIIASKLGKFDFDKVRKSPRMVLRDFLDKGDGFEYLKESDYTLIANPTIQKSGLIFVGYRNKSIRKAGVRPGTEHLSRVHKQPNRIYSADGIHPTLPSQETAGRFFVLADGMVRKLTQKECYRLMGFPTDFKAMINGESYKQVGNAVCVPLVQELAYQIKKQFFNNKNEK